MTVAVVLSTLFLVGLSGALTLSGSNICTRTRLVPSTSVFSLDDLLTQCEHLGFTATACDAARNNDIQFNALYVVKEDDVCCAGYELVGNVCTACPDGMYGEQCSIPCRCFKSTGCDHVTGACSCSAGWKGEHCELRCAVGEYGPNCALSSSDMCENDGVSHPSSGHCLCSWTWTGNLCSQSCPPTGGCPLESDSCSNGAIYDPTGHCVCAPGYRGRYCTERCNNTHGAYCRSECQCENDGLCNWEDGSCLCRPGYQGDRCEHTCPDGTFGADCALTCDCPGSGNCHHINGSCSECPTGFTGSRCLQHCPQLWWGPSCNTPCDCQDGSSCDRFTGQCPDGESKTEADRDPSSSTATAPGLTTPRGERQDSPGVLLTTQQVQLPADTSTGANGSSNDTLVILTAACVSVLSFCALLFVTAYVIKNKPCRREDSIKPDPQPVSPPNTVAKSTSYHANGYPTDQSTELSHVYADIPDNREAGEYIEIRGDYEVPMTVNLDRHTGPTNPNSTADGNRYERHPNYATTIMNTNRPQDIRPEPDGYMDLNQSLGPPPAYHTLHVPANI